MIRLPGADDEGLRGVNRLSKLLWVIQEWEREHPSPPEQLELDFSPARSPGPTYGEIMAFLERRGRRRRRTRR